MRVSPAALFFLALLPHSIEAFQSPAVGARSGQLRPVATTTDKGQKLKVPAYSSPLFMGDTSTQLKLASSSASSGDVWVEPAIQNRRWFRSLTLLLTLTAAFAAQQSPLAQLPSKLGAALHLFCFATWFGTVFYTTFIFGITAFRNLPRQAFGKLQSKLFPKYFSLGSICILLQILTIKNIALSITNNVKISLGSALLCTMLNQFYIEPYSTKIMLERYDLENKAGGRDTERYKELKSAFGKFHGISSLTNLVAMCGAVAYGFALSSVLKI